MLELGTYFVQNEFMTRNPESNLTEVFTDPLQTGSSTASSNWNYVKCLAGKLLCEGDYYLLSGLVTLFGNGHKRLLSKGGLKDKYQVAEGGMKFFSYAAILSDFSCL